MESADAQSAGATTAAAQNQRLEDYRLAIGPNTAYYLPRFEELEAGGPAMSWHWPAFFVTTPWFLYRKMWLVGILNVVYPFLVLIFGGIAAVLLAGLIQTTPLLFSVILLLLLAAPWFLLPMYANALYFRHVRNLIDKMPRVYAQDPEKKRSRLERDGGTGVGGMIAVCAALSFFYLFIIGALAAIAIPAYQDYTIRAQVFEGLNLAAPVKAEIAEYWDKNLRWPEQADLAGAGPIGKYVSSVGVASGSVVITYGNEANAALTGKRLVLLPGVDTRGRVHWICGNGSRPYGVAAADGPYGTDLANKHLPVHCRSAR